MRLDVDAARAAIEERCAARSGLDVIEAAYGIVEIANAAMVNALHLVSVQRGYDPRDFVLVAFGGAGPVHANAIAREAEMPTVLVPPSPGIFSATGLLTTDLKRDAATTVMRRARRARRGGARRALRRARGGGAEELAAEGLPHDRVEFQRKLDVRYVGQSFELTHPGRDGTARALPRPARADLRLRGPGEPVEIVSLRLTSVGRIAKPPARMLEAGETPPRREHRPVYFAESGGYVDCAIHDRNALPAGARLAGPAVVEELDSTTLVHPGYSVRVDDIGNLIIERERA